MADHTVTYHVRANFQELTRGAKEAREELRRNREEAHAGSLQAQGDERNELENMRRHAAVRRAVAQDQTTSLREINALYQRSGETQNATGRTYRSNAEAAHLAQQRAIASTRESVRGHEAENRAIQRVTVAEHAWGEARRLRMRATQGTARQVGAAPSDRDAQRETTTQLTGQYRVLELIRQAQARQTQEAEHTAQAQERSTQASRQQHDAVQGTTRARERDRDVVVDIAQTEEVSRSGSRRAAEREYGARQRELVTARETLEMRERQHAVARSMYADSIREVTQHERVLDVSRRNREDTTQQSRALEDAVRRQTLLRDRANEYGHAVTTARTEMQRVSALTQSAGDNFRNLRQRELEITGRDDYRAPAAPTRETVREAPRETIRERGERATGARGDRAGRTGIEAQLARITQILERCCQSLGRATSRAARSDFGRAIRDLGNRARRRDRDEDRSWDNPSTRTLNQETAIDQRMERMWWRGQAIAQAEFQRDRPRRRFEDFGQTTQQRREGVANRQMVVLQAVLEQEKVRAELAALTRNRTMHIEATSNLARVRNEIRALYEAQRTGQIARGERRLVGGRLINRDDIDAERIARLDALASRVADRVTAPLNRIRTSARSAVDAVDDSATRSLQRFDRFVDNVSQRSDRTAQRVIGSLRQLMGQRQPGPTITPTVDTETPRREAREAEEQVRAAQETLNHSQRRLDDHREAAARSRQRVDDERERVAPPNQTEIATRQAELRDTQRRLDLARQLSTQRREEYLAARRTADAARSEITTRERAVAQAQREVAAAQDIAQWTTDTEEHRRADADAAAHAAEQDLETRQQSLRQAEVEHLTLRATANERRRAADQAKRDVAEAERAVARETEQVQALSRTEHERSDVAARRLQQAERQAELDRQAVEDSEHIVASDERALRTAQEHAKARRDAADEAERARARTPEGQADQAEEEARQMRLVADHQHAITEDRERSARAAERERDATLRSLQETRDRARTQPGMVDDRRAQRERTRELQTQAELAEREVRARHASVEDARTIADSDERSARAIEQRAGALRERVVDRNAPSPVADRDEDVDVVRRRSESERLRAVRRTRLRAGRQGTVSRDLGRVENVAERAVETVARDITPDLDRNNRGFSRMGIILAGTVSHLRSVGNGINRVRALSNSPAANFFADLGSKVESVNKKVGSAIGGVGRLARIFILVASVAAPLVSVLGSLAAVGGAAINVLVSLAGTAAALPGLFLAGAAGIGALVAAIKPIAGVFKAYQAAQKATAAGSDQLGNAAREAADKVSTASRSYASALRSQNDASRDQVRATRDLNDARREATRQLEDLQTALSRINLDEEGATLALRRAQESYRQTIAGNSSLLDREEALHRVKEAENDLADVRTKNTRLQQDANREIAKGVEGSDRVVSAQEAQAAANQRVIDSAVAVKDAARELKEAQDDLAAGGVGASKAQQALQRELDKLSPSARVFVEAFIGKGGILDAWKQIQQAVQEPLFRPLVAQLGGISRLLPVIQNMLVAAADSIGRVAAKGLAMVSSGPWTADFNKLAGENATIIDNLGTAILYMADALRNIAVAAAPFTRWVTQALKEGAISFAAWSQAARNSGDIFGFLEGTRQRLHETWVILKNLGAAFVSLFVAAKDFTDWWMKSTVEVTQGWRDSAKAQEEAGSGFKTWLENVKPLLHDIAVFIGAVSSGFAHMAGDMGNTKAASDILKALQNDILPPLSRMLNSLGQSGIISGIAEALGGLLDTIAEFINSGAAKSVSTYLEVFFNILSTGLSFLMLPGVKQVFVVLAISASGFFAAFTAARMVGFMLFAKQLLALAQGRGAIVAMLAALRAGATNFATSSGGLSTRSTAASNAYNMSMQRSATQNVAAGGEMQAAASENLAAAGEMQGAATEMVAAARMFQAAAAEMALASRASSLGGVARTGTGGVPGGFVRTNNGSLIPAVGNAASRAPIPAGPIRLAPGARVAPSVAPTALGPVTAAEAGVAETGAAGAAAGAGLGVLAGALAVVGVAAYALWKRSEQLKQKQKEVADASRAWSKDLTTLRLNMEAVDRAAIANRLTEEGAISDGERLGQVREKTIDAFARGGAALASYKADLESQHAADMKWASDHEDLMDAVQHANANAGKSFMDQATSLDAITENYMAIYNQVGHAAGVATGLAKEWTDSDIAHAQAVDANNKAYERLKPAIDKAQETEKDYYAQKQLDLAHTYKAQLGLSDAQAAYLASQDVLAEKIRKDQYYTAGFTAEQIKLTESLVKFNAVTSTAEEKAQALGDIYETLFGKTRQLYNAQLDYEESLDNVADSQANYSSQIKDSSDEVTRAKKDEADALKALKTAGPDEKAAAQEAYNRAKAEREKAEKTLESQKADQKAASTLNIKEKAGRQAARSILDLIDASREQLKADIAAGDGTVESVNKAKAAYDERLQVIKDQATQSGITKDAVDGLIKKFGQVPTDVKSVVSMDTGTVEAQFQRILEKVQFLLQNGFLPPDVTVTAHSSVDSSNQTGSGRSTPGKVPGTGSGGRSVGTPRAGGGFIDGPETSTTTADDIHVLASRGEFMQRALAVQYYGRRFMEDINAMRIPKEELVKKQKHTIFKYATGGAIGEAPTRQSPGVLPMRRPSAQPARSAKAAETDLLMQVSTKVFEKRLTDRALQIVAEQNAKKQQGTPTVENENQGWFDKLKKVMGMSTGGRVRGYGGPTDDMNPRLLSNEEWVIPARAARLYGDQVMEGIIDRKFDPRVLYAALNASTKDALAPLGAIPKTPISPVSSVNVSIGDVTIHNPIRERAGDSMYRTIRKLRRDYDV